MPFWSAATVADPKRSFRWIVELAVNGLSDQITYICKKVNKPTMEVGESEHKFLNHTFYYPGGVTYDTCTITLVDPANPHSTEQLFKLIQDSGYQLPSAIDDTIAPNDPQGMASTISKRLGMGAIKRCVIVMLDGNGNRIEETELFQPWIKKVDFGGELDYESEGLMEITMEMRYDWFELRTFDQE